MVVAEGSGLEENSVCEVNTGMLGGGAPGSKNAGAEERGMISKREGGNSD